jgi:hypothetical protein
MPSPLSPQNQPSLRRHTPVKESSAFVGASPTPATPRFAGGTDQLIRQVKHQLPLAHRGLNTVFRIKEGASGAAVFTFFQDLLVSLGSRAAAFRGAAEGFETSLLELLENLVVYFGLKPIGGGMNRLSLAVLPKQDRTKLAPLLRNEAVTSLPAELLKKLNSVKAATAITTLAASLLCGEYIILHLKNLMTAQVFKKDRFTDVIGLSQGHIKNQTESPVLQKSKNRMFQLPATFAAILAGSLILARTGHKSELVQNTATLMEKKGFLLTRNPQTGKLEVPFNLIRTYMFLSIPGYLDAARDKQERIEAAIRLPIVMGYLAFGQGFLEKILAKTLFKDLQEKGPDGKIQVKRLTAIEQEMQAFLADKADTIHADKLVQETYEKFGRSLKQRNIVSLIALMVGALGTGTGLAFLNRSFTAHRYRKSKVQQQAFQMPRGTQPAIQRRSFAEYVNPTPNSATSASFASRISR